MSGKQVRAICLALAAACIALAIYLDGIPNWRVLLTVAVVLYWVFAWNNMRVRVERLERRVAQLESHGPQV